MCGRFALKSSFSFIKKEFSFEHEQLEMENGFTYKRNYNISPGQSILIILKKDKISFKYFKWGLIPHWAKGRSFNYKMINARAETLLEKSSFKNNLKNNRCLIIADGFYEWKKTDEGKIPFYVSLKSEKPFSFAGLYDRWVSPENEEIYSCTIITTDSNEMLKPIHDRIPVIIKKDRRSLWIEPEFKDYDVLKSLLRSYDQDLMKVHRVSKFVNTPKNNSPECISEIT